MNIAIVVAAGSGERLKNVLSYKKQFEVLGNNKEMFLNSLTPFLKEKFDVIALVVPKEDITIVEDILKRENLQSKIDIIFGGKTRQESVKKAIRGLKVNYSLEELEKSTVFIHDGDRPLLSRALVRKLVELSKKHYGIVPYIPINDSVYDIERHCYVNRNNLRRIQTPQVFNFGLLDLAYKKNEDHLSDFLDDGSIVKTIYDKIQYIEGEPVNVKVTDKHGLDLVNFRLSRRKKDE